MENLEQEVQNVEQQETSSSEGNISPPQNVDVKADIMKEVGDYLLKFENKILSAITQKQPEKEEKQAIKKTKF